MSISKTRHWFLTFVQLLLCCVLIFSMSPFAQGAPTEDDVKRAKADEANGKKAVAAAEAQLANVNAKAQKAFVRAEIAGEDLAVAKDELDAAQANALKARNEANDASKRVEGARKHLAQLAANAYRSGSSLQEASPYLAADGLESIAMRKIAIDLFGGQADKKMQTFQAIEQVARVMQNRASEAEQKSNAAARRVAERFQAAQAASQAAAAEIKAAEVERQRLIERLAQLHGRSVQVEKEYQAEKERQRRERAAREARERAEREARRAAQIAAANKGKGGYGSAPKVSLGNATSAVAAARQFTGVPYVWGGESASGVDCSGLVKLAYGTQGIKLPHSSRAQYTSGKQIPLSEMQPGDLIFWSYDGTQPGIHHVAMYVGNGQMIEAHSPGVPVGEGAVRYDGIMPFAVRP